LFWYSGGLAQQDRDEPEPHVLRWDEVDSVTPLLYDESGCVGGCRLRGRTGTEIAVSLGYGLRDLVGEADRVLARLIEYAAGQNGIPVTRSGRAPVGGASPAG
jgi:hypothetical protein